MTSTHREEESGQDIRLGDAPGERDVRHASGISRLSASVGRRHSALAARLAGRTPIARDYDPIDEGCGSIFPSDPPRRRRYGQAGRRISHTDYR